MNSSIPIQESGDSGFDSLSISEQSLSLAPNKIQIRTYYKMNHEKRGQFIIINNHIFNANLKMENRIGSCIDNENLKKIFEDLKFDVKICENQTVEEMRQIIVEASKVDHSKSDCFAMAILSHGDSGGTVYGIDGTLKFEHLIEPLSRNKVTSLIGKPKLFFIQACRGHEYDDGVGVQYEQDAKKGEDEIPKKIPSEADFLYSYSTAPGYVSFRNKKYGSWYIQALKKIFEENAANHELMHLLTLVNFEVAHKKASKSLNKDHDEKKQVPSFISMLTKFVKF